MSDTTRTFLAVAVPQGIEPRVSRLVARLEAEIPEGRWGATYPWHITLAFLGDVSHADLASVCRVGVETSARYETLELSLRGVGAFPDPRRPSVVWTGVEGPGIEALRILRSALVTALSNLGYPSDSQPFRPHVTLGRFRQRPGRIRDLTQSLDPFRNWSAGPFLVEEVVIFASTRSRSGPEYIPLGHAPLDSKKAHDPA
jgi:2'-5' RNA ligase